MVWVEPCADTTRTNQINLTVKMSILRYINCITLNNNWYLCINSHFFIHQISTCDYSSEHIRWVNHISSWTLCETYLVVVYILNVYLYILFWCFFSLNPIQMLFFLSWERVTLLIPLLPCCSDVLVDSPQLSWGDICFGLQHELIYTWGQTNK